MDGNTQDRAGQSDVAEHVADTLMAAMPGWRFVKPPVGFGWAPQRHFRARIAGAKEGVDVVIRQSWRSEGFAAEVHVYRELAEQLPAKTARLLGTFSLDSGDPDWIVLEDLGTHMLSPSHRTDREAFLLALGRLHAWGESVERLAQLKNSPLPVVPPHPTKRGEWRDLLRLNLESDEYSLEPWMPDLCDAVWERLAGEPPTLLHGDADFSNALWVGSDVALIDWERACIGPAALDLGRVIEATESSDELEGYASGYRSVARRELSAERLRHAADLGDGHNCLRWVCYYINGTSNGKGPPSGWRRNYYEPCLARLRHLHERRRHDWC